jgi:hypothetical protein
MTRESLGATITIGVSLMSTLIRPLDWLITRKWNPPHGGVG